MSVIKFYKAISSLPNNLLPDTVYYVRVGEGYSQFITDGDGLIAHSINKEASWIDYASQWSSEPSEIGSTADGTVFEYTLDGTTRYRLVPDPYDAAQDAFYADWDGTTLSNLIITRG